MILFDEDKTISTQKLLCVFDMDETEHYHHQKGKKMERKDGIISESKTTFIDCYYIQQ